MQTLALGDLARLEEHLASTDAEDVGRAVETVVLGAPVGPLALTGAEVVASLARRAIAGLDTDVAVRSVLYAHRLTGYDAFGFHAKLLRVYHPRTGPTASGQACGVGGLRTRYGVEAGYVFEAVWAVLDVLSPVRGREYGLGMRGASREGRQQEGPYDQSLWVHVVPTSRL